MRDTMSTEAASKPGFFKYIFITIFQGFLLGIGLCVVFAGFQMFENRAHADRFEAIADTMNPTPDALVSGKDFKLEDVREIQESGGVWIVGRITNLRPNKPLRTIELQANLFKSDVFVDQYTHTIYGGLRAGETRLFKISCGCKGNPPGAHDRFEVKLITANY